MDLINCKSCENIDLKPGEAFYLGIDPTAEGIHIGHLIPILAALRLIELGFQCVILLGSFTGQIGDPTGKSTTRNTLDESTVANNSSGILEDIKRIFKDKNITYVNNNDWLGKLSYRELIAYGSTISLHKMLRLEFVKSRVENQQPITFTEFNYPLMQAIDFLYLYRNYNCRLQIGGGDQWGNISFGTSFVQKITGDERVFGLTTPLLLNAKGEKMSKTDNNSTVWIKNPMSIWQFCINLSDENFDTIKEIFKKSKTNNSGQITDKMSLAKFIITISHDQKEFEETLRKSEVLFRGAAPSSSDFVTIKCRNIVDVLMELDFTESRSDAKRKIKENSVYVNDTLVQENFVLSNKSNKISLGKKKIVFVRFDDGE
jgi:tyrosyl-tRNA synthetase